MICLKCLAKEPAARYATAEALADDLDRWLDGTHHSRPPLSARRARWSWTKRNRPVAALSGALAIAVAATIALFAHRRSNDRSTEGHQVPAKSIAVLPFENRDAGADNAYVAQGIQDEILTRLGKIGELKVISRASTERFTSSPRNLREIAQQLGVANFLEGNIRTAGDAVRVHVQLINASTSEQLWSESYDRKMTDIFAVETEIAKAVADKLQARLTGSETRAMSSRPTENAAAHQLYLKGRFFWNKRTAADLKKAIEYFDQAIGSIRSSRWPTLPSQRRMCWRLSTERARRRNPARRPKLRRRRRSRSIRIWPRRMSRSVKRRGSATSISRSAGAAFRRALELDPNYANGHHWYGNGVLTALGRFDEAIAELKRALELDPLSLIINADLGTTLMFARRYDESAEQYRRTLEMDPNFHYARWGYGVVLELQRDCEGAFREFEAARRLNDDPWVLALQAHAHRSCGDTTAARRLVDELNGRAKTPGFERRENRRASRAGREGGSDSVARGRLRAARWIRSAIRRRSIPVSILSAGIRASTRSSRRSCRPAVMTREMTPATASPCCRLLKSAESIPMPTSRGECRMSYSSVSRGSPA